MKNKKIFLSHLIVFIIINILLFLVDYYDLNGESHEVWWFYWTSIFWGIGVCIHGISILVDRYKK